MEDLKTFLDELPKRLWDWYGFEIVQSGPLSPHFLHIGKPIRGAVHTFPISGLRYGLTQDGNLWFSCHFKKVVVGADFYAISEENL